MLTEKGQQGPVNHMQFEDDQGRSLVGGIAEALKTKKAPPLSILPTGSARSCGITFTRKSTSFSRSSKGLSLQSRMNRFAGELQKFDLSRNRQELLDSLRRLQSHYMGKAA
jgi:hypothetical protein